MRVKLGQMTFKYPVVCDIFEQNNGQNEIMNYKLLCKQSYIGKIKLG